MPAADRRFCLFVLTLVGFTPVRAESPAAAAPLRTATAVLSLSAEEASRRLPVSVTGVVTAAEPRWSGQFFVQDDTAGVFVENLGRPAPSPGDVVVIEGVSHPGAFAPIISSPQWHKIGTAPLPQPKTTGIEDLNMGAEDSQRVEITGVVRTGKIDGDRLLLDVSVEGQRLRVQTPILPGTAPGSLVAARVRIRGTVATEYIGALRHLTSVVIYAPRTEDVTIIESEAANPFDQPVTPVNSVAQYRRGRRAEQRVHVRGVVTLQRPAEEIFLQDNSGGIRVVTSQDAIFRPGDVIDAVGFLEYENHLPLLRDGVLRLAAHGSAIIPAREVSFARILRGEGHCERITLHGRILDRSTRPNTRVDGSTDGVVTTWLLQTEAVPVPIEYASRTEDPHLSAIPIGSQVSAEGVCVLTVDATGKMTSMRLLLDAADHLRVLEQPSWFTPARLLTGLGILSAVLVAVFGWLLTVSKKNKVLHRVVKELEEAQLKLQEAHDTLEQKVAERSAQLQIEMTARKEAELEFKAVLTERTRLARDLHDTLEQTLAGIALRLNTVAKLSRRDPDAADAHLQFARSWLHQSQVDLRRSIWDLRSRELEQFDLANALRYSAEQVVQGTRATLDFQTSGRSQGLPEVVEENVLRIAQEAMTNIAKHAGASHVTIRLEFEAGRLRLVIEDNGVGFEPAHPPRDGHFGLVGMAERVKRLGGTITVTSKAGQGTSIAVEIPLTGATPEVHETAARRPATL